MSIPWYEQVDSAEELMQGDFVTRCPIVIPRESVQLGDIDGEVIEYDVVIMSQSCDLVQRKLELVLVCPFFSLADIQESNDYCRSRNGLKALKEGNIPGYHLLDRCRLAGHESGFLVVDFRSVYGVPFGYLVKLAESRGSRLRLLSPYREHLAQAFARFFMRVGLPVDIPLEELRASST